MSASSATPLRKISTTITISQDVVSCGSDGVQVFIGYFLGNKVAVKRILRVPGDKILDEVNLLRNNIHEHIVEYHDYWIDDAFCYIAMEMCPGTLEGLVSQKYDGPSPGSSETILCQITKGLAYLHSKKIVHRDLKPNNILIAKPCGSSPPKMKLADFGISKKQKREYYFSNTGTTGTIGWAAPELFDDEKETFCLSVDIFSLGCIFAYVLTGHHPYGEAVYRTGNILKGKLAWVDKNKLKDKRMKGLIKKMIAHNHKSRPDVEVVLKHLSTYLQPSPVRQSVSQLSVSSGSTTSIQSVASKSAEDENQPKKASSTAFASFFSRRNSPTNVDVKPTESVSKEPTSSAGQQNRLLVPAATGNLKTSPTFPRGSVTTTSSKQLSIQIHSAHTGGLQNFSLRTESKVNGDASKDYSNSFGKQNLLSPTGANSFQYSRTTAFLSTSPQRSPGASSPKLPSQPLPSPIAGKSRSCTSPPDFKRPEAVWKNSPHQITNGAHRTPPLLNPVRSDSYIGRQTFQYASLTTRRVQNNPSPTTSTSMPSPAMDRNESTSFTRHGIANLSLRDSNAARRRFFSSDASTCDQRLLGDTQSLIDYVLGPLEQSTARTDGNLPSKDNRFSAKK